MTYTIIASVRCIYIAQQDEKTITMLNQCLQQNSCMYDSQHRDMDKSLSRSSLDGPSIQFTRHLAISLTHSFTHSLTHSLHNHASLLFVLLLAIASSLSNSSFLFLFWFPAQCFLLFLSIPQLIMPIVPSVDMIWLVVVVGQATTTTAMNVFFS